MPQLSLESIWLVIFHSKKHLCQIVHRADKSLADKLPLQLQKKSVLYPLFSIRKEFFFKAYNA